MSGWLHYPKVAARSTNYATGRQGYRPLWFVIHCTATDYAHNYPANLGRYWATTDTQVSVHFCCSDTMTYQYVSCEDTAYQARNPGNLRGIGVELVGQTSWTRNEWLAHKSMLRRAAQLCAEVSATYGLKTVPALLGPVALKDRASGLTCHNDLSKTFSGTHTDPAPNFPWDFFNSELNRALLPVVTERARAAASTAPTEEGDGLMAVTEADFLELRKQVSRLNAQCDLLADVIGGKGVNYPGTNLAVQLGKVLDHLDEISVKLNVISPPHVE